MIEADRWRYAIAPAVWAHERLGYDLDPWQADALNRPSKRVLFNAARQSGKSTVAAIKALHRAMFYPGSLVILLSPSQRQSAELFRKVTDLIALLPPEDRPVLLEDNKLSLTTSDGSRIVSLPSNEKTIRGYSAVSLIIEDEAAAVPDEIYTAVRPMLAVSNGAILMLSTPRGRKGHFYDAWVAEGWERYSISASDNPRISREFLEDERRALGSRMFAQEYLCEFVEDMEGGMFQRSWFANSLVDAAPEGPLAGVRFWDMAATEAQVGKDPDWTAGVRMVMQDGRFWIVDVVHVQLTPLGNENTVKATAALDGRLFAQRMEEEGGSSGKSVVDHYQRQVLLGYNFKGIRSTGSKVERAKAFSAACEAGNVLIVRGLWDYHGFIDRLCAFPMKGVHDDEVDAAAGAFNELAASGSGPDATIEQAVVTRSSIPSFGRRR